MNSSTLEQYLETGVKAQKMMITSLVWKGITSNKNRTTEQFSLWKCFGISYNLCCVGLTNHSSFAQYLLGIIPPNIFPSAGVLFFFINLVQVYLQHWLLCSVATPGPGVLLQPGTVPVLDDVGTLLGETAVLVAGVVGGRVVSEILVALKQQD